jgi:hypothetical protein
MDGDDDSDDSDDGEGGADRREDPIVEIAMPLRVIRFTDVLKELCLSFRFIHPPPTCHASRLGCATQCVCM